MKLIKDHVVIIRNHRDYSPEMNARDRYLSAKRLFRTAIHIRLDAGYRDYVAAGRRFYNV